MEAIILNKKSIEQHLADDLSDSFVGFKGQDDGSICARVDWLSAPLYLCKQGNEVFASYALSALKENVPESLRFSKAAILDYIKNGPSIQNQSIYEGVTIAQPGSLVEISPTGDIKITKEADPRSQTHETLGAEQIESLLCASIQQNLQRLKGKRVCFALSGGVDSTLIVTLAKRHNLANDITCYTADTGSGKDLMHAQAAAEALGVTLIPVKIGYGSNALAEQARVSRVSGNPIPFIGNSIGFSLVCKRAKQDGFGAIFDGTGGDQIFAGTYKTHGVHWYPSAVRNLPEHHAAAFHEHIQKHSLLAPDEVRKFADEPVESFSHYLYDQITQGSLQNWRVQHRASALANELLIVTPFITESIAKYIWSPLDAFYQNGINKYVLRQILEKYIPDTIAWRVDNQGLRWPTGKLYRQNKEAICKTISEKGSQLSSILNRLQRFAYSHGLKGKPKTMRLYSICSILGDRV